MKAFIWTFHCAYEVTQRITTGSVIPLEASVFIPEKAPQHKVPFTPVTYQVSTIS